jgi:hypothetical protein
MLNGKEYENIIIKNDKYTEDTNIALGLVKKYVIENKLLIVGGMAIDFALKLKSSKLYDDDVLPDYDFYSPHHHKDAYHIAERLHKAGLKNISVVNANHVSTMRVRVNYTVVADVTYIPQTVFDNMPTIPYKDLLIIHPHYQMIDQHRALSNPYENAPWEVIKHRWKKDMKRYDMLYDLYPLKFVADPEISTDSEISNSITTSELKLTNEINIPVIDFQNQCISGFAALLYWQDYAEELGFKSTSSIGTFNKDNSGFTVQIPVDSHGVTVYSNDIRELYKKIKLDFDIKKERWYNRFLDKLPSKVVLNNQWELMDAAGTRMSAHKHDNIYIANLQNVMMYMLTNYILLTKIKSADRGHSFYLGYIKAYDIVKWSSEQYAKTIKNDHKKAETIIKLLPTPLVYGDAELSDSYLNAKRIFLEKIDGDQEQLQPQIIFTNTFKNGEIPKKYYEFDATKSRLFTFDGAETSQFKPRITSS